MGTATRAFEEQKILEYAYSILRLSRVRTIVDLPLSPVEYADVTVHCALRCVEDSVLFVHSDWVEWAQSWLAERTPWDINGNSISNKCLGYVVNVTQLCDCTYPSLYSKYSLFVVAVHMSLQYTLTNSVYFRVLFGQL